MRRVILVLLALILLVSTFSVAMAAGTVTASAIPSNAFSSVGQKITVTVRLDVNGAQMGGYGGRLLFDPTILQYESTSGAPAGWTGVVNATQSGKVIFNGINVQGATGRLDVLTVTFTTLKAGRSPLTLTFSEMAETYATVFTNLLPGLTIRNSQVWVLQPFVRR